MVDRQFELFDGNVVGKNLREIRSTQGITQEQLAQQAGSKA